MQTYMATWLGWRAGTISDGEVIARMHVDPFFKRFFEERRRAMFESRQTRSSRATG